MCFGMIEWRSEIRDNCRRISETETRRRGVDKLLIFARDLSRGDQHGDATRIDDWREPERSETIIFHSSFFFFILFFPFDDLRTMWVPPVNDRLCSVVSRNYRNPRGPWPLPRRRDMLATSRYASLLLSSRCSWTIWQPSKRVDLDIVLSKVSTCYLLR